MRVKRVELMSQMNMTWERKLDDEQDCPEAGNIENIACNEC